MLDQVLQFFEIVPDFDLDIMQPGQTLTQVTTRALEGLGGVLRPQSGTTAVRHRHERGVPVPRARRHRLARARPEGTRPDPTPG